MPVTSEQSAPYAPAAGVLDIINRYRNRGMQTPINAEVLGRAGVSESLISRTLQALTTLDLISEEGMPTETFEGIRVAPEAEYKQRLQEWLRAAYADVFSYVDPAEDDEIKIRDAFRTYRPMGQQSRMVSLFIGLCAAAGLRPERPTDSKPRTTPQRKQNSGARGTQKKVKTKTKNDTPSVEGLPSAIEGLLRSLPEEGKGWTQEKHDSFMKTFEAVLNFCYPIVSEEQSKQGEDLEEDED